VYSLFCSSVVLHCTDQCNVNYSTHTSPICNLYAGTGTQQNGQPDDCPYGTDAACRVENGSGSIEGNYNPYNADCSAFGRTPNVASYTRDYTKNTDFDVTAVLVHSGKCLSGVSV
jgi:hypothetical protein